MPDIYFKCQCGKCIAVDQRGEGVSIACPDCGGPNTVPAPEITWDCDGCSTELSAPKSMIDQNMQCLQCMTMLVVPRPSLMDMLPAVPDIVAGKLKKIQETRKIKNPSGDHGVSSAATEPGICQACGTARKPGAMFCGQCGARVAPAAATPPGKPASRRMLANALHTPARRKVNYARLVNKVAALAAVCALAAGLWIYRAELPGLWAQAKPAILAFLDKTSIYRPKPPALETAASETDVPAASLGQLQPAPSGETVLTEDATPQLDDVSAPTRSAVTAPDASAVAMAADARRVLAEQTAFLGLKNTRETRRLEILGRVKALQADMAKYAGVEPGDFNTMSGTAYKDVRLTKVEPDGISIIHSAGACKIPFDELPERITSKYGYDPAGAKLYAQAAADTREMAKVLASVANARQTDPTIATLIAGMTAHHAAVNMDQADALLEKAMAIKQLTLKSSVELSRTQ